MLQANRETRAAGIGAAIVALFTLLTLATGLVDVTAFLGLWLFYIKIAFSLWLLVGFVAVFILVIRAGLASGIKERPFVMLRNLLAARWERDRFVSMLWPPLLFATLLASFNAYKQMVLVTAEFRYDALFEQADRALFFGVDPWRITHWLFSSPDFTLLIDRLYHGWFVPMSLGVVICAWASANSYRLRNQYLLTYIGIWVGIGSILSYIFPAAGPCFAVALVDPQSSFAALNEALNSQQALLGDAKIVALRSQAMLLASQGQGELIMGGGISAMPSVHNALAVLFALAAWRINKLLGGFLWLYAFAIWFGSVHLGWHYAIDGLIAAALTFGIWRGSGLLVDRLERPLFSQSRQPELQPAV